MSIQLVNIGRANKGDGDPIRVAFDKINQNFQNFTNDLENLSDVVDSIPNTTTLTFDFGSIVPKQVFSPIELLFYASQIDMGTIVSPTPVLYDAGTLG
jgi:hypothetical protein